MDKKLLILPAVVLAAVCAVVLLVCGKTYTLRLEEPMLYGTLPETAQDVRVEIKEDIPAVALTDQRIENGALLLRFRFLRPGRAILSVFDGDKVLNYSVLYAHPSGVITCENRFGDCTGDVVIPAAVLLYLACVLFLLVRRYRADVRRSMYQYRNVMGFGLILFLCFLLAQQASLLFRCDGVLHLVNRIVSAAHMFSVIVLPAAFVLSILITVSNINLMRKEGRSWRNRLGAMLGVGLCLLTLAPTALESYLQWSPNVVVDVHNEKGVWLYIEIFVETFTSATVTYLECMLIGTVFFGVKAARHIPAFDKDYILILGCQIKDDGTLTPLLKSRADRAVEFARMQKEKTGVEPVFVPSGGQGPDEVIAEADAIKNYLLSEGIPEDRILAEGASVNTYENIRNSMALIRKHAEKADPKVAFSTTNYHVFRAGLIAQEQGESLEGIGSPTKRYFWLNAFIREFVATLVSERRKHIAVAALLAVSILLLVIIKYLSVAL